MRIFEDIYSKIPEITKSLETLIDDDKFQNSLNKVETLGSLISLGIEIYGQIKNSVKTDYGQAILLLIKITFESAKETLDEINKKHNIDTNIEIRSNDSKVFLFKDYLELLQEEPSNWNYSLLNNPAILKFRENIVRYS